MKTLKHRLEQILVWFDTYGWVIPTFLLGVGFGLIVMALGIKNREFTVAVVAAIGTVSAAGAALWTTLVSRKALNKQLAREQELKQPNLVLSGIEIQKKGESKYNERDSYYDSPAGRYTSVFRMDAQLTNLGEFPIYVKKIHTTITYANIWLLKTGTDDEPDQRGFLIPPNISVQRTLEFSSLIPTYDETVKGQIAISFQYGPTAKQMHHLQLEVNIISYDMDHALEGEIRVRNDDEAEMKHFDVGYNYDRRMYNDLD